MQCEAALATWENLLLKRGKHSVRTLESYKQVLVRLDKQGMRLTDPPEQVSSHLLSYRDKLQSRFEAGKISRSYIRLHVAAIRLFYKTLVEAKLYPADPTTGLKSIASKEGVPRPLASQAVDRLFSAVDLATDDGPRDLVMLWLYYHSLRNSEVANLETSQVMYSAREDAVILQFEAKGGKVRTVALVPEAGEALAWLILNQFAPDGWDPDVPEDHPNRTFALLDMLLTRVMGADSHRIFWYGDNPMTRRQSNRIFRKYADEAGVDAGPHSLRHTCATTLLDAGVDLFTLRDILGHSSVRQTQVYTQVMTGQKTRAMNKLPRPGKV